VSLTAEDDPFEGWIMHHPLMKVWLKVRRRDITLTPAGQTAAGIVLVLAFLGANLTTLINHEHLGWQFWVSLGVALCLLASGATSLVRRRRAGDRIRITADLVSDPPMDRP